VPIARIKPWVRAFREALLGDTTVLAAGVALFALLAAIPGVAAIVAIYALVSDPGDIGPQLEGLDRVLPRDVVEFITNQLAREAGRPDRHLGIALITTMALALYSSRSVADALIVGLNRAYGVTESRHPLRTFALSVAVAAVTLLGCFLVATIVVALPALLALLELDRDVDAVATWLRWPLLLVVVNGGLMALYRAAPSPRDHDHRHLWPGALVATGLMITVSLGLSLWVEHVADYQSLYGAFSGVLVLILWLYISAVAVLLGGLVNAELERNNAAEEAAAAPPAEAETATASEADAASGPGVGSPG
jgi:membrane protein